MPFLGGKCPLTPSIVPPVFWLVGFSPLTRNCDRLTRNGSPYGIENGIIHRLFLGFLSLNKTFDKESLIRQRKNKKKKK